MNLKKLTLYLSVCLVSFGLFSSSIFGDIVINELMYHPSSDNNDEEYLELYNTGDQAVNLLNYTFTDGISFTFTNPVSIAPKEFLVVASNADVIRALYGIEKVVGNYDGQLSNGGETVILEDNLGRIVDELTYSDSAPWPVTPDGDGPSLELINPDKDNNDPFNWRAGAFPGSDNPWGTPGAPNSIISSDLPPRIDNPRHRPERPVAGEPISIRADVVDDSGIFRVWVEYRVEWMPGEIPVSLAVPVNEWLSEEMRDDGTRGDRDAGDESYETNLPNLPAGVLIHYKIHALDFVAQENVAPVPTGYPKQFGILVRSTEEEPEIPEYTILLSEEDLTSLSTNSLQSPGEPEYNDRVRGIFIDHSGEVYEDVQMRFAGKPDERQAVKSSWKLYFNDDFEFDGREELILDAQFHPSLPSRRGDGGLYESIAWEVFRHVGVPSRRTTPVTMQLNGFDQGIFLQKENIEEDFLARIGKDRDSNLYRSEGDPRREYPGTRGDESILPTLEDYLKTYDNVTNSDAAHEDLITFIERLNTLQEAELENFFNSSVNVNELLSFFAAGNVVVHEDRVWHNHFLYHDSATDRWEIFPENLTHVFKTAEAHLLYDVQGFPTFQGPWPLATQFLTIPEFQGRYYENIRQLLVTIFQERELFPLIEEYVSRIREHAELDRQIWGELVEGYRTLDEHVRELKDLIGNRRISLIDQLPQPVLISNAFTQPAVPSSADPITFGVDVLTSQTVERVVLHWNAGSDERTVEMELADGSQSIYQTIIPAQPDQTEIQYYFSVTFTGLADMRYPEAPSQSLNITVDDNPMVTPGTVVINEIMYHSAIDENEWFELYNAGQIPVDLSGWVYKDDNDDHRFLIPDGTILHADGYVVIALDAALVTQLYGITNVIDGVTFNLGNGGDAVRIFDPDGQLIDSVQYDDEAPWPSEADGNGPSLELIEAIRDNGLFINWLPSDESAPRGTPGRRNSVSPPPTAVADWMMF